MTQLGSKFPQLVTKLVTERDIYMSHILRRCPGPVVVGVVGLGHLKGTPHPAWRASSSDSVVDWCCDWA